jgi:hypothetical protein
MNADIKKDLREILIAIAILFGLSIGIIILALINFSVSQKYPIYDKLVEIFGLISFGVFLGSMFIRWLVRKWQHAHPKL